MKPPKWTIKSLRGLPHLMPAQQNYHFCHKIKMQFYLHKSFIIITFAAEIITN